MKQRLRRKQFRKLQNKNPEQSNYCIGKDYPLAGNQMNEGVCPLDMDDDDDGDDDDSGTAATVMVVVAVVDAVFGHFLRRFTIHFSSGHASKFIQFESRIRRLKCV